MSDHDWRQCPTCQQSMSASYVGTLKCLRCEVTKVGSIGRLTSAALKYTTRHAPAE